MIRLRFWATLFFTVCTLSAQAQDGEKANKAIIEFETKVLSLEPGDPSAPWHDKWSLAQTAYQNLRAEPIWNGLYSGKSLDTISSTQLVSIREKISDVISLLIGDLEASKAAYSKNKKVFLNAPFSLAATLQLMVMKQHLQKNIWLEYAKSNRDKKRDPSREIEAIIEQIKKIDTEINDNRIIIPEGITEELVATQSQIASLLNNMAGNKSDRKAAIALALKDNAATRPKFQLEDINSPNTAPIHSGLTVANKDGNTYAIGKVAEVFSDGTARVQFEGDYQLVKKTDSLYPLLPDGYDELMPKQNALLITKSGNYQYVVTILRTFANSMIEVEYDSHAKAIYWASELSPEIAEYRDLGPGLSALYRNSSYTYDVSVVHLYANGFSQIRYSDGSTEIVQTRSLSAELRDPASPLKTGTVICFKPSGDNDLYAGTVGKRYNDGTLYVYYEKSTSSAFIKEDRASPLTNSYLSATKGVRAHLTKEANQTGTILATYANGTLRVQWDGWSGPTFVQYSEVGLAVSQK